MRLTGFKYPSWIQDSKLRAGLAESQAINQECPDCHIVQEIHSNVLIVKSPDSGWWWWWW